MKMLWSIISKLLETNIILKYPQFELLEPFRFIFQLLMHVKCMLACNIELSVRGIIKNLNALEQAFSGNPRFSAVHIDRV